MAAGPPDWMVVALVAAVVSVPLLCGLVAIVAGLRALRAIRTSSGLLRGRGLALAGVLLGALGLAAGALAGTGVAVAWWVSPGALAGKSDAELGALVDAGGLQRRAAAQALAQRGRAGRDRLLDTLFDASLPVSVRLSALEALQASGPVVWRRHVPQLLAIMGGTEFELQTGVSELLAWRAGLPPAHLLAYLTDEDAAVRAGAVAVVNDLVQRSTRWGGASPLGAAELPLLERALTRSADRDVRLAVIDWLAGMGPAARRARGALEGAAADSSDGAVSAAAAAVLASWGGAGK